MNDSIAKTLPLDKSWIIRMGVLDIANGFRDIETFLLAEKALSDDLLALQRAAAAWRSSRVLNVGESGTLYRFLLFLSWKQSLNKEFVIDGTLKTRIVHDNPSIINWSLKDLLKLDGGTSQWASAAVLLGNTERVTDPPYKLELSYEAVAHWKSCRAKSKIWSARRDETIRRQAEAFRRALHGKPLEFEPLQAEDYCFARAFGLLSAQDGERLWSALRNHESDRIAEMEMVISSAEAGNEINATDHRVVQAIAMWGKVNGRSVDIRHPGSVCKSWPLFWDFLATV